MVGVALLLLGLAMPRTEDGWTLLSSSRRYPRARCARDSSRVARAVLELSDALQAPRGVAKELPQFCLSAFLTDTEQWQSEVVKAVPRFEKINEK